MLALALAPGTWLRSPKPPVNREQALALTPLVPGADQLGPFRVAGLWQLTSRNTLFGSYSALVEAVSGRLLAFSDRGDFLEFAPPGAAPGAMRIGAVPGNRGRYKAHRDVEAASRDSATGQIFLALEGSNVVARHAPDLALEALRAVPEMRDWGGNTGPEAMVRLSDGRFIVLCECRTGWLASGAHPGLLFARDPTETQAAVRFTFAGPDGYRPTDMALLPDGRVLVLARRLVWPMPARFQAKLLLADPDAIVPGGTWRAVELADLSAPLPVDNFEALTISAGANGALSAWLLSDDNQAISQRSLLWKLDFSLADLPASRR